MPNNYSGPDDSTQPLGSPPQNYHGPQGKLVLGAGGAYQSPNPQPAPRRPYQYPGQPAQAPVTPPGQFDRYGQPRVATPPPFSPGMQQQPGQFAGRSARPRKKRSTFRKILLIISLTLLTILVVLGAFLGFVVMPRVMGFAHDITPPNTAAHDSPLGSQTNFMNTSDRTNLLIVGYGGGSHQGALLTDSMVVTSMIPSTSHTSLVSVPRDLEVQDPRYASGSGYYTKLNAVYEFASNTGADRVKGATALTQKIDSITGLTVQYWMMIDFTGFQKLIDSIGGVDVYVPDSFNACYPKNDDDTVDASWVVVQFNKGQQHMDGATAIQYARAREPLSQCQGADAVSENQAELTDFARSARQQLIVKSVLSQIQQIGNWPKLFDAMDALKDTVYTNMPLIDLGLFARKMNLSDPKTARVGLSNQNVLVDSSDDNGYILVPQNGDWTAVSQYVQSHLYP